MMYMYLCFKIFSTELILISVHHLILTFVLNHVEG